MIVTILPRIRPVLIFDSLECQPLLPGGPRTAASSQKASQADCSVCQKFALEIPAMIASTMNSVARTQIDTPIMPVTSPAMA